MDLTWYTGQVFIEDSHDIAFTRRSLATQKSLLGLLDKSTNQLSTTPLYP